MENLAKVNARHQLIWVSNQRRGWQNNPNRGKFWKEVLRENILSARKVGGMKPYYHPANALD